DAVDAHHTVVADAHAAEDPASLTARCDAAREDRRVDERRGDTVADAAFERPPADDDRRRLAARPQPGSRCAHRRDRTRSGDACALQMLARYANVARLGVPSPEVKMSENENAGLEAGTTRGG